MQPTCIDLQAMFGRRFKIGHDPAYWAEYGPHARVHDPWLLIVPCRYGHIFPHGGDWLAASVDGYPKVAGHLRCLPCCHVHQDGDHGELTVIFRATDFPRVAPFMRPKRRRQVSEKERARLLAMGYRKPSEAHVHVQHSERPCVPVPEADLRHLPHQRTLFGL